jgi:hypothetical protein
MSKAVFFVIFVVGLCEDSLKVGIVLYQKLIKKILPSIRTHPEEGNSFKLYDKICTRVTLQTCIQFFFGKE